MARSNMYTIFKEFLKENIENNTTEYIKLQRCQHGVVSDEWDFNISNGQHGTGVYAFKYGDEKMADYYSKNGETIYTFQIPKKYFIDISNKNWDFWDAKKFIHNNPQYKAFMFKHAGVGVPTSKEILITDSKIIELL